MNRDYYGPHLMVDILEADRRALGDLSKVSRFLDELPDKIGMKKLTPPIVFPYHPEGDPMDPEAGITGFIVIAESHISIHTYPHQGRAYFDAFSCRPFKPAQVLELLLREFIVTRYDSNLVKRGALNPRCALGKTGTAPAP